MEKKEVKNKAVKKEVAKFKANEIVTIIGTKKAKHLVEGEEYKVDGLTANEIINKGYAKAK